MLGHINIPMHMVDVHILFCRVGNPSLVAALILFHHLWFSPLRLLGAPELPDAWCGVGSHLGVQMGEAVSTRSELLAPRFQPWACSSSSWVGSSCIGTEQSPPQLCIYSAWIKIISSYACGYLLSLFYAFSVSASQLWRFSVKRIKNSHSQQHGAINQRFNLKWLKK